MEPFDDRLNNAVVGVAGLGGLGSMVAAALVRTGIGRLILCDFDRVEASNLNRQHYFRDQIGRPKVEATVENLLRIDPEARLEPHNLRLDPASVRSTFGRAHVVAECLDRADQKQMLAETVLADLPGAVLVTVSGIAGFGLSNEILTRRLSDRVILVGDGRRDAAPGDPLTAGRVWIAAAHQANAIVEVLMTLL